MWMYTWCTRRYIHTYTCIRIYMRISEYQNLLDKETQITKDKVPPKEENIHKYIIKGKPLASQP